MLASRSPQRRAILTQLGIPFTVVEPGYIEIDPPGERPSELVVTHAVGKARSVGGPWVLGVDTTVALDGDSLAKPADADEAGAMLRRLAGPTPTAGDYTNVVGLPVAVLVDAFAEAAAPADC